MFAIEEGWQDLGVETGESESSRDYSRTGFNVIIRDVGLSSRHITVNMEGNQTIAIFVGKKLVIKGVTHGKIDAVTVGQCQRGASGTTVRIAICKQSQSIQQWPCLWQKVFTLVFLPPYRLLTIFVALSQDEVLDTERLNIKQMTRDAVMAAARESEVATDSRLRSGSTLDETEAEFGRMMRRRSKLKQVLEESGGKGYKRRGIAGRITWFVIRGLSMGIFAILVVALRNATY